MAVQANKETLGFQTEAKQLLHLMINALYSNKEIFLRELISNSSDAIDKLRFEALSNPALLEGEGEFSIHLFFDKDKKIIRIEDNGIGMSREEVMTNLGTIARSGTKEFLAKLTGDQKKDSHLIGQFGVGFYSAFMIAEKIIVTTRRAGQAKDQAVQWTSAGEGEYTLETVEKAKRGTIVELHVKADEIEFLDYYRLRSIIVKYSDHITAPIFMLEPRLDNKDEKEPQEVQVNKATALWTLAKNAIKDEDYQALYKHIAHDFDNPLLWIHSHVEGRQDYYSLLYIPKRAPFDLYSRETPRGLKLYVKRVFIMDDAEQLLPMYLRFVRGVIDSSDLPLNVSREILQRNRLIENIKSATTKKVLSTLEKLAKDKPEEYQLFWESFGKVLKEGPAEDQENREQIAGLLRFSTTHTDSEKETVTLEEYIARMKSDQKAIYYVTAENFSAAKYSPHLEIFRKNNIEVLLLGDRVDEWLTAHLEEYKGKKLESITKGDLDLGSLIPEEEKEKQKQEETNFASLVTQMKEALATRVKDVRITHRLTTSPACVVSDENEMGLQMQRIMKAAGQEVPESLPILEINPEHRFMQRLKDETDDERFKEWALLLLDQSILAEGGQLENASGFVSRLNKLLLEMM